MKKKLVLAFCVGLIAVMVWAAGNVVPPSSGGASIGTSALLWLNGYFTSLYTTNFTAYGTITLPADGVSLDAVNGITATAAEINLNTAAKTATIGSIVTSIATNANGGTNVVTFTCKDLAGTTMSGYHAITFWISDSAYGVPAAVAGDVAISGTGAAELIQHVDKAVYTIQTSNGVAIATITDTPGGTNYITTLLPRGGISTPVVSAFNVP